MKTRLLLPDGTERALTWTNRHPKQASQAGLVLFRHSSEILDGPALRQLVAQGARLESTHPDRIRAALRFDPGEPGIYLMGT